MEATGEICPELSRSASRNRAAAVIGPIVCDDEGPIPNLKISKVEMNMKFTRTLGMLDKGYVLALLPDAQLQYHPPDERKGPR